MRCYHNNHKFHNFNAENSMNKSIPEIIKIDDLLTIIKVKTDIHRERLGRTEAAWNHNHHSQS